MNKNVILFLTFLVENLEQEELLKRHASPKGNNANLICFTAGSIGNKKVNSGVRNNLSKPKK